MNVQFSKQDVAHSELPFSGTEYDTKQRFSSYWHQINEITNKAPEKILEVGKGNGFTSRYLTLQGYDVISLDILIELRPTAVGSVLNIPFRDNTFDVVSCFEVLEHIPYTEFQNALLELKRVSSKHIVISIPDLTPAYRFLIELPVIRPLKKMFIHPFPRLSDRVLSDEHFWEIGVISYPFKKILKNLRKSGLIITETYRVFEMPYHRFILLEKAK